MRRVPRRNRSTLGGCERLNGGRRIDNPNDWVRIEIEAALQQSKNLIPVLVDGANMPRPEILPESLRPLARRNAVRLTHERFKADASGLVAAIEKLRRNRAQQHEKVNALLEQPELSSVLSAVTFYSDADKYRAVLVSNDEASADLCIFREGSLLDEDVPFERAVLKRNAAWCGRMAVHNLGSRSTTRGACKCALEMKRLAGTAGRRH